MEKIINKLTSLENEKPKGTDYTKLAHKKQMLLQSTNRVKTSLKTLICLQTFAPSKVTAHKAIILAQLARRRYIKNEIKELLK